MERLISVVGMVVMVLLAYAMWWGLSMASN